MTNSLTNIGDGSHSPILDLSPKQIQDFYHSITGETEELNRLFDGLHQIEESDIENLHLKVLQTSEQFDVLASELRVKIYYENDQSEKFSSFERFRLQGKNEARKTESVVLNYKFLLKIPQTKTTQSYEIFIRVASNVVEMKDMQKNAPSYMWNRLNYKNGHVSIEFVDYTVARTFMATISEWFEGLKTFKPNPIFNFLKRKCDAFPSIFRSGFIIFYLVAFLFLTIDFSAGKPTVLLKGIVISIGLALVVSQLGWHFGDILRRIFSAHIYPSYVCITKGDERLVEELNSDNRSKLFKGLALITLNIILSVSCSIAGSYIYNLLK